jgi:glycerophosphoryl diester phosphodiesterase
MTSLSDTLTVGFVLVLLFGSIALYLFTCIQQSEQKISLLESILLDLKMSAEFKSYTELPAEHEVVHVKPMVAAAKNDTESDHNAYVSFDDAAEEEENSSALEVEDLAPLSQPSPKKEQVEPLAESSVLDIVEESVSNYETMSLKELQSLALTRGITGAKSMKKGPLQEALRTSDRVRPGSDVVAGSSSFVESSASVSDETA